LITNCLAFSETHRAMLLKALSIRILETLSEMPKEYLRFVFDNALHRLGEDEKSVRKMCQPIGNKGPVWPSSLRVSVYTRNVLSISSKYRSFMKTNKNSEMRQKILKPSISHLVILNLV
jgi:hypothetical protein